MDSIEGVWFRNPKTGFVHKVVHIETIARCRAEGHTEVPDPRLPVEFLESAPAVVAALDAVEQEAAQLAATIERNDSAREAFAFALPPERQQGGAKPVKRVPIRQHGNGNGKGA